MVDNCAYNGGKWCEKPLRNQQVLTTILRRLKGYDIDKNGQLLWRQGGVVMGNTQMVGPNSPSFSTLFSSHSSMLYYTVLRALLLCSPCSTTVFSTLFSTTRSTVFSTVSATSTYSVRLFELRK